MRRWQKVILPPYPSFHEEIQAAFEKALKGKKLQLDLLTRVSESPDSPNADDAKRALLYVSMVAAVKGIHAKEVQEALQVVVCDHGSPAAKEGRMWLRGRAEQRTDMQLRLAAHAALSFLELRRQWMLRSSG